MDRFTEPTPASPPGRDLVEVFVSDWEIECCAPPPVVGEPSSWTLQFISAGEPYPTPELDREHTWQVQRRDELTVLTSGAITAAWSLVGGAPPEPGSARLCGHLAGTVHDGFVPDEAPRATGLVQRIRLVSQLFTASETDNSRVQITPVPGMITMTDVARSPRWFSGSEPRWQPGVSGVVQTGVLLELSGARTP
ncbi:DUF6578 domain-containing protein [Pseudonocardia sp. H11422]|uniref:DUF6578 domain-containing protein n=1 Tax=Pseudonocardia sp. H11422 TaxID=2835866 RepID=UPI001BDCBE58|nr:DUF6578 domain-containing protein [Pseudonocardia sp. H11422]